MNDVITKPTFLLTAIVAAATVSSYGKTTRLEPAASGQDIDLGKYSCVIVLDFEDQTTVKSKKPKKIQRHQEAMLIARKYLADQIAAEIRSTGIFDEVSREPSTKEALLISGSITRYQKGDAAARLMIGMGAGSSYFDADVRFKDNITGSEIGFMKVDKESWGLGGGLAATQSVEHFMQGAARKIAKELSRVKDGN